MTAGAGDLDRHLESFRNDVDNLRRELAKRLVGRQEAVDRVLAALLSGGHVLLEGLPGSGKTYLARTLADVMDITFRRIQCTPDLMPTDIIGTYVIMETPQGRRTFEFHKGPLFGNVVLVDQVNRAMPKTQSAMLEAMDEEAISVSTESFPLPRPFLMIATQNPGDFEGTYLLPAAQLDRFFFKIALPPFSPEQTDQVLERAVSSEKVPARKVVDCHRLVEMGEAVRKAAVPPEVRRWAAALIQATQPSSPQAPELVRRYVRCGSGVRGAIAMVSGGKALAMLEGRTRATAADLRGLAHAALAHRLVLSFEGQADGVQPEAIVDAVLAAVPAPA